VNLNTPVKGFRVFLFMVHHLSRVILIRRHFYGHYFYTCLISLPAVFLFLYFCCSSASVNGDERRFRIQSVKHRRAMGRREGLRARCRHRCSTWWITCKCHHTVVDTCRTCAAGCTAHSFFVTVTWIDLFT